MISCVQLETTEVKFDVLYSDAHYWDVIAQGVIAKLRLCNTLQDEVMHRI